jgi:hypothetical protein
MPRSAVLNNLICHNKSIIIWRLASLVAKGRVIAEQSLPAGAGSVDRHCMVDLSLWEWAPW